MKRLYKISFSIADIPLNIPHEALFRLAKETHVDGIEVVLGYQSKIGDLFSLSKRYQIPILSLHQPISIEKIFYKTESMFELASKLKAKLVIHPLKKYSMTSITQQEYLKKMSHFSKKYHVDMLLENMSPRSTLPFYKYVSRSDPSTRSLSDLRVACKKYEYSLTFDTSHYQSLDLKNDREFLASFNLIKNIHLSDFDDSHQHLPLGDGNLDSSSLLQLLRDKKYSEIVTLELAPHAYYSQSKYLDGIRKSIKKLS